MQSTVFLKSILRVCILFCFLNCNLKKKIFLVESGLPALEISRRGFSLCSPEQDGQYPALLTSREQLAWTTYGLTS